MIFTAQYRLHMSSYVFICDCPARDPVGLDSDLQNLGILSPTIVPAWLAKYHPNDLGRIQVENFHEGTHRDNLMRLQYPTLLIVISLPICC